MHRPTGVPFLALLVWLASCKESAAPAPPPEPAATAPAEDPLERLRGVMSAPELEALSGPRGLRVRTEAAFAGHTLVAPLVSTRVHLVDLAGDVAHTWETGLAPGGWCRLLDDGSLLHVGRQDSDPKFRGGGIGGIIRRLAPNGEVLWRMDFADDMRCQHHDALPLPNGNLLLIAWDRVPADEALALGRRPGTVGAAGLWTDALYEVRPTLPVGGEIVWSWHAKDHLVQDFDATKPNHAKIADRPGRIDVNFDYVAPETVTDEQRQAEAERKRQMAALGYGGGDDEDEVEPAGTRPAPPPKDFDKSGDWMHTNAVAYHPQHELLVLSSYELSEVFIIDHSTTTAEAATSSGGRYGRGGDLLWRWGNPANHGAGSRNDQRLFNQHDPTWLSSADPNELRMLVFNNGGGRPNGKDRSEVLELAIPFDAERGFATAAGRPYLPREPAWRYESAESFFSAFISGAQRLANGNTLICSGAPGRIFEVTRGGEIVWEYLNPYGGDFEAPDHAGKAPPLSLYRVARYAPDHAGLRIVLAGK